VCPDAFQADLVAGDGVERPVVPGRSADRVGAPEPLVGQASDARGEPVAQHPEQAEDDVGVAGRVGGHHLRLRAGVDGQDRVEDEQRVAQGARHDYRADPGDLVVDGIQPGDAPAQPEVARAGTGVDGLHGDHEPQPVDAGKQGCR
jgi:hypothetical protein